MVHTSLTLEHYAGAPARPTTRRVSLSLLRQKYLDGNSLLFFACTTAGQIKAVKGRGSTLARQVSIVGDMCNALFLYVIASILNWRPGYTKLRFSITFVVLSYMVAFISFILGIILSLSFKRYVLEHLLPDLAPQFLRIVFLSAQAIHLIFSVVSLYSVLMIIYKRDHLQALIIDRCTQIWIQDTSSQTLSTVNLFRSYMMVSVVTYAVYDVGIMSNSIKAQSVYLISWASGGTGGEPWPKSEFLLSCLLIVMIAMALLWGAAVQHVIPMLIGTMSLAMARHAQDRFEYLYDRLRTHGQPFTSSSEPDIGLLEGNSSPRASTSTDDPIPDFNMAHIYHEWPELVDLGLAGTLIADWPETSTRTTFKVKRAHDYQSHIDTHRKILAQLQQMVALVDTFQAHFSYHHVALLLSSGLVVAHRLFANIIEIRLLQHLDGNQALTRTVVWKLAGSLVYHNISAFGFIYANTVFFLACERLPSQLRRLTNQLLYHNVDATRTARSAEQLERCNIAWCLYDQIALARTRANFRLDWHHYGKQCLLAIMSRELSLVLLLAQVVDIISAT